MINYITYSDKDMINSVYVDIVLGNLCSYACSYCPPSSHDGSAPWLNPNDLTSFFERMLNHYTKKLDKNIFLFNFLGGEPTLYPHFEEICNYLKDQSNQRNIEIQIEFTTNGYRKLSYWKKNIDIFDVVKITHHLEYADPYHTREVADLMKSNNKGTTVMVPMKHDDWETGLETCRILNESKTIFTIDPKVLLMDFSNFGEKKMYPYTPEQLEFFKQPYRRGENEARKFVRLGFTNEGRVQVSKLISEGKTNFQGWSCYAGIDILQINTFGNIKIGGRCAVNVEGFTGKHFSDPTLEFPTGPVICTQNDCTCGPDINTRKLKV